MSQVRLNLHLAPQLGLDTSLLELALVEDLQSTKKPILPFFCKINTSELSFSKRSSDFKHSQIQLTR